MRMPPEPPGLPAPARAALEAFRAEQPSEQFEARLSRALAEVESRSLHARGVPAFVYPLLAAGVAGLFALNC